MGPPPPAPITRPNRHASIRARDAVPPILIPISGNTADERAEEFFVQLANAQNATLAENVFGVVTITDEAPVDLAISDGNLVEGNQGLASMLFLVTLRQPLQHAVTVDYFTSDGTALAGLDYVATNASLTFPAGAVEKTISVPVIGDLISEPDETFYVNLTNALNGVIRNNRGTGTITDDDSKPCLNLADSSVLEGNAGVANVLLSVHLSSPSSTTVSVEVRLPECRSSAMAPGVPVVVTFAPGQTEHLFVVPIVGDLVHEANESCQVILGNPVNATICRGEAVLTVIDDDPLPGLEINDVIVSEGNVGTTTATFIVTLVGATTQAVSAQFTTSDGTATSGSDYIATSGLVTFAPGVASASISVVVNGDLTVEPDELFYVTLSAPNNASLFRAQGSATIVNDDSAPQADCPSVVALATPDNQTCFAPFAPILLTGTADQAADQVQQMEFYSGSTLLGVDTTSPFEIVWEGAPVGDYCITAKAICKSGRSVRSEPTCIGVTDSGAAVAIVRNFDDPEINQFAIISWKWAIVRASLIKPD